MKNKIPVTVSVCMTVTGIFYAVIFKPIIPTSSNPTKSRRGAVIGSWNAKIPTSTAPSAPMSFIRRAVELSGK